MLKCLVPIFAVCAVGLAIQGSTSTVPAAVKAAILVRLEGRISDDLGRPLSGVEVELFGGIATRWSVGKAVTNENGIYRFEPAPTGYVIQHKSADGREISYNGLGMRINHPRFAADDNRDWWEFRIPLEPGTYYRDMRLSIGGNLKGTIKDSSGKPAAGLDLRVIGIGELTGAVSYSTTDANGDFEIDHALRAGKYEIQVNDPSEGYPVLSTETIGAGDSVNARITRRS